MKLALLFIVSVFWSAYPSWALDQKPTASELLQASDRARGAASSATGLLWTAEIETVENGENSKVTYDIKVRGNDALAVAVAPARQKGETILFNDRVLWFLKPGLRKPVSISQRQRLTGQASNGDIVSTQYARDYEGDVVGEETINGTPTWKLELKAKTKNVTYDRIRYWISKTKRLGVRAEFLTLEGGVFKSADFKYANSVTLGGTDYPFVSEMVIQDAANKNNVTTIRYRSPREANNPPSLFNVNNLLR